MNDNWKRLLESDVIISGGTLADLYGHEIEADLGRHIPCDGKIVQLCVDGKMIEVDIPIQAGQSIGDVLRYQDNKFVRDSVDKLLSSVMEEKIYRFGDT